VYLTLFILELLDSHTTRALQPLMQRFLSLDTECVKIQETANASQGISSVLLTPAFYFYVLVPIFLMVVDASLFFVLQSP
jgi:hypothetical protein